MKNKINKSILAIAMLLMSGLLFICCAPPQASESAEDTDPPVYEVSDKAEAHMELVTKYIEATLNADRASARSLVTDDFMSYGPSANDSANIDQVMETWTTISTQRTDQDAGVNAATTLRVNTGDLAGEWVHLWGTYTAKLNDSDYDYQIPWHGAYFINDGKIQLNIGWWDNLAPALATGSVAAVEAN